MSAPPTLNHLFFDAVERFSTKRAALRYKAGGAWRDITHQELARRVHHAAVGLRELGLGPGDRVAILSANRPEWAITDYACLAARCVGVAVHATLPAKQIAYILNDSGARAVFIEDQQQYAKVAAIRGEVPTLQYVIAFSDVAEGADAESFQHFLQRGAAAEARYPAYREEALAAAPEDLATLIYTSGTTGEPKGVMLTHGNFTSNVVAALRVLRLTPEDSCLSFLPLSHSLERMGGHYTMFHAGATICYAESIDTIASNLLEVRPTVVIGVPRVFEKIHNKVVDTAMRGGAVKRRIFFWTQRVGRQWVECTLARKPVPRLLEFKWRLADRLVYAKLRARTGGRIRFFVSGSAPLPVDVATFFFAARLPVLEGYGLSETSPVVTLNSLEAPRLGSVGKPIAGVDVRIAPDGEILVRGPNVMAGYYNRPQATSEVLDSDGWFHTGDVGELDQDGYLRITDRKKDLIKTAGGKYVAPQLVENLARTSPFVQNSVLLGDRRPYPILLVVPNPDAVRRFAQERGLHADSIETLLSLPDVVAKVEREVMLTMRDLATHEMPKKVVLIPQDFTIENGLLTPSMKVKRKAVEQLYQNVIEAAYQR
ncbi:MAG TPA: long-chain fatty acid--CoA ligase [Gemmatimonadales bacterium]|nr:long-chain fatty acid--CoA ligase [Gemmatimonadales bacterium]